MTYDPAAAELERAARDTGFTSSPINHACTLALYRAGDLAQLADVAFEIGVRAAESDPPAAMDYFQRAFLGGLGPVRTRRIGEVFESWAEPPVPRAAPAPVRRVAQVLGSLQNGHPATEYVRMLCGGLAVHGVECVIFTTETFARWFIHENDPAPAPDMSPAGVFVASAEGDFLQRARRIAGALRAMAPDAILYHSDLSEQITARVAAFRPARRQVNVNHGAEMDVGFFEGFIHRSKAGLERSRYRTLPSMWLPCPPDTRERPAAQPPVAREALGLAGAETVSATFGDLEAVCSAGYLDALATILRRFPNHYHLFAGTGDVKAVRGRLHAENVLQRVRFLGPMPGASRLLSAIDVYLDSFPQSGESHVLDAMAAGKPVVAVRGAGGDLAAAPELVAETGASYASAADRLLRDAALRQKCGSALRARFDSEFDSQGVARRFIGFVESL